MSQVTIRPGEAGAQKVAQQLLATAATLGLPADVVEWSPSLGGFRVPEQVAAAYASAGEPELQPVEETVSVPADDPPAGTDVPPPATATMNVVLPPVAASMGQPPAAEVATPRRYSDGEKAAAVAAVAGGRTIADVAAELGASATSVSKWVAAAKEADNV